MMKKVNLDEVVLKALADQKIIEDHILGKRAIVERETGKKIRIRKARKVRDKKTGKKVLISPGRQYLRLLAPSNILAKNEDGEYLTEKLAHVSGRMGARDAKYHTGTYGDGCNAAFLKRKIIGHLGFPATYERDVLRRGIPRAMRHIDDFAESPEPTEPRCRGRRSISYEDTVKEIREVLEGDAKIREKDTGKEYKLRRQNLYVLASQEVSKTNLSEAYQRIKKFARQKDAEEKGYLGWEPLIDALGKEREVRKNLEGQVIYREHVLQKKEKPVAEVKKTNVVGTAVIEKPTYVSKKKPVNLALTSVEMVEGQGLVLRLTEYVHHNNRPKITRVKEAYESHAKLWLVKSGYGHLSPYLSVRVKDGEVHQQFKVGGSSEREDAVEKFLTEIYFPEVNKKVVGKNLPSANPIP
jgi:hypothetical protein